MLDLIGVDLDAEEREILRHPAVGGVILFSRNFEDPEQVAVLIASIHELRDPHLLVAVDQEGGRVQRFRKGFTRLPPARRFGELGHRQPAVARRAAKSVGWLMAAELRSVGVDFSFAPVLDLDRGMSRVIGDRAFADGVKVVSDLALAWTEGVHEAGMAAVGKHFPGHGGVAEDSHEELPVDGRSLQDIEMEDLSQCRPRSSRILRSLAASHPAATAGIRGGHLQRRFEHGRGCGSRGLHRARRVGPRGGLRCPAGVQQPPRRLGSDRAPA
jgi:beta-N-acetylhexosaminidase